LADGGEDFVGQAGACGGAGHEDGADHGGEGRDRLLPGVVAVRAALADRAGQEVDVVVDLRRVGGAGGVAGPRDVGGEGGDGAAGLGVVAVGRAEVGVDGGAQRVRGQAARRVSETAVSRCARVAIGAS
jgi:hypothetical protein